MSGRQTHGGQIFFRTAAPKAHPYAIMSDKELMGVMIDQYGMLQRIKKANGDQVNSELDYELKLIVAKLSSWGVNVEDITLN